MEAFLKENSKPNPASAIKVAKPETPQERYQRKMAHEKKQKEIIPVSVVTQPSWISLFSEYITVCRTKEETPSKSFEHFEYSFCSVQYNSFLKYKPKQYKLPRAKTDLCNACFHGNLLFERKLKEMEQIGVCPMSTGITDLLDLRKEQLKVLKQNGLLSDDENTMLEELLTHKCHVAARRNDYKQQKASLTRKQVCLLKIRIELILCYSQMQIVIDFKKNLELGKGEATTNDEFFSAVAISVFGLVITYRDEKGKCFCIITF